jgi:hypothetical protein
MHAPHLLLLSPLLCSHSKVHPRPHPCPPPTHPPTFPDVLTFGDTPFLQPGCDVMFSPGAFCFPKPALFVQSCCTPGFACVKDSGSLFGYSCQQLPALQLNYTFEEPPGAVCKQRVAPGAQCGELLLLDGRPGEWVSVCGVGW